jgi:two-component system sensor histidine kinase BaeS
MQDGVVSPDAAALASLHEETLRLSRLVADLGTLASAEAAGFALERTSVRLDALVAESAREFAGPYESQDVRLDLETEPVEAVADAMRVHQILANLLSNALKFTPSGGTVAVALTVEEGTVVLRVADTGPGIPADELPHIFDRFFRGRDARARGSGIGLTVARELARAHGGEVDVSSEPGRGTTFIVQLPASPTPRPPFTPPSHPAATVGSEGGDDR